MKYLVTSMIVLTICAPSAMAIGDQGPNMLGFYFDTDATEYYAEGAPYELLQVHLILTNPTMSEISGWEAGYDIFGSAWINEPILYNGGVNSLSGQYFSVTYLSPLHCTGPTPLASIPLIPIDDSCNCIRLFGVEEPSVPGELPVLYLSDGSYLQVETCVFDGSDASAQLNGDVPVIGSPWPCEDLVQVSGVSWGALKRLFR